MQRTENEYLRNGDILHFKYKGLRRFLNWPNKMQSGILITIKDLAFVVTVEKGQVSMISLFLFQERFQYVSSSPNWKTSPIRDVLTRFGWASYENSDQFIGEILGAMDFDRFKSGDVLKYCIKKGWF